VVTTDCTRNKSEVYFVQPHLIAQSTPMDNYHLQRPPNSSVYIFRLSVVEYGTWPLLEIMVLELFRWRRYIM
jgi:hypothetical protein